MTSVHSLTVIRPGEILSLNFCLKSQLAVPGIVSTPASRNLLKYSFVEMFDLVAP